MRFGRRCGTRTRAGSTLTLCFRPLFRAEDTLSSISLNEFANALRPIIPSSCWPARLTVAVSGGPDSIALLHLLAQHARHTHPLSQVVALTVDHRLRPESAYEAAGVHAFSSSIGVEHHTLPIAWSTPPFPTLPPPHGTEAPARAARLLLFRKFMNDHQIETMWMGHHQGDQIENLLLWGYGMRSVARMGGTRVDGSDVDPRWVVRPLLGFEKDRLVATCHAHSLPYFIDPTNLVPSHTPRNHLRSTLASFHSRHLTHPHSLSPTGGPLALLHGLTSLPRPPPPPPPSLPTLFTRHSPAPTTLTLTPSHLPANISPSAARAHLRRAIALVAPASATISHRALEHLRSVLWDPASPSPDRRTQSLTPGAGVVFERSLRGGAWTVSRQRARRGEMRRRELRSGEWVEWDERVWVRVREVEGKERGWFVEERGRWGAPFVVGLGGGVEGEEIVFDFGASEIQKGVGKEAKGGSWTLDGVTIDWSWSVRDNEADGPTWQ